MSDRAILILTQRFPRPAQRHTQQAVNDKQRQDHQKQQGHQIEKWPGRMGRITPKQFVEGIPAASSRCG